MALWATEEGELSELLATAGVLPMFGFPPAHASLYDRKVRSRRALENAVVSDRPLDMAVSAFSPGAQIVRDGLLHTAVGFAHYEVKGKDAYPVDPLGPALPVGACGECKTTFVRPQVGAVPGVRRRAAPVRPLPAARLPHLIRARDYDDSTDTASHAGIPVALRGGRRARTAPRSRRSPWRSTSRRRSCRSTTTAANCFRSGGSPTAPSSW